MGIAAAVLLLAQSGGEYLPLDPGASWTYEVRSESAQAPGEPAPSREVTSVVHGAATLPDGEWIELSRFLGYETCWVKTSEAGVELRTEAVETAPVLLLLKLPARAGDAWSGSLGRETASFTAGGEQTLDDGRRALRVDFRVSSPEPAQAHAETRGTLWFERGTGLVRASLTKDLDCHAASTTVYRLKR